METADSCSLVLEPPREHKELFLYKPAQFLSFQFLIDNKKYLRSYSLSSSPLANEPLQTTVKRVKEGVVSNYILDSLHTGDHILSRKPAGRFWTAPKDLKAKHYYLFAGGSGITPLFSIIKTALLSDPNNKVTLLYANRNEESIIYDKELKDWAGRFKQLRITHILSRPKNKTNSPAGRLTKSYLKTLLNLKKENELFYLCGPLGFMTLIEDFLTEQKIPKTGIFKESFFTNPALKKPTAQSTAPDKTPSSPCSIENTESSGALVLCASDHQEKQNPEFISALIDGEKIKIPAKEDIPILEQLLSAGHSPPFSCLSGNCMSCLAVLKKGRIFQEERGILEDENVEKKEILTCQAQPESPLVEVDYDNT